MVSLSAPPKRLVTRYDGYKAAPHGATWHAEPALHVFPFAVIFRSVISMKPRWRLQKGSGMTGPIVDAVSNTAPLLVLCATFLSTFPSIWISHGRP